MFNFMKFMPSEYVLQYKKGIIVNEGTGISFLCFAPTTSIVVVPIVSSDVPFIFEEVTNDFQTVTLQGQLTYRIVDYKKIAQILDYTYNIKTKKYANDNSQKIAQRLINISKVLTKKHIEHTSLKEAITSSENLAKNIIAELRINEEIISLGIEVMGFSILAILPNKDPSRALEAQAREQILKKADEALYERRTSSIEQERRIKEIILNTEIALEMKKTQLIELSASNAKAQADAKAYELTAMMKSFEGIDSDVMSSLANMGMQPDKLIAMAFQELAQKADQISQLNLTPELLQD